MSGLPPARTVAGAAGLAALLADPAGALVALDYDGTLAPIVDRPDRAWPHPNAVPVLARLAGLVGAVAVITGRPVRDVLALSGVARTAGLGRLVVLGQYGLEHYDAETGRTTAPEPSAAIQTVRERLPDLLAAAGLTPEAIEDKQHAIVVHTRRAADPPAALERIREPLRVLAAETGLEDAPGRLVVELRPPGFSKGLALLGFARERSARAVLFAGDDVGDLPAYDAVAQLRTSGVPGVTVCSASAEVGVLAERADVVVDGPAGVVALLAGLADAITAGAG